MIFSDSEFLTIKYKTSISSVSINNLLIFLLQHVLMTKSPNKYLTKSSS